MPPPPTFWEPLGENDDPFGVEILPKEGVSGSSGDGVGDVCSSQSGGSFRDKGFVPGLTFLEVSVLQKVKFRSGGGSLGGGGKDFPGRGSSSPTRAADTRRSQVSERQLPAS